MFCKKCGEQVDVSSRFCHKCGESIDKASSEHITANADVAAEKSFFKKKWSEFNPQEKKKFSLIFGSIFLALLILIIIASSAGRNNTPNPTGGNNKGGTTTKPFSIELENGHFTAGIDFPGGTYNIVAIKGGGNVISSNLLYGGLNQIMGIEDDDFYIRSFNNAKLPKNTVLSVSGVRIRISSSNADTSALDARKEHPDKAITLSSGNYTAGVDFPTGIYSIEAYSGNGNVSSSNLVLGYGINAIMGVDKDDFYEKKYYNIDFTKSGTTLTVSSLTIKLIPVSIN